MELCTIIEFRTALAQPSHYFRSLRNINADLTTLCRSRHFAECRAVVNGQNAIIYAPISPVAIEYVSRAQRILSGIQSRCVTPMQVYSDELRCGITCERYCSIIIEFPVMGTPLAEALYTMSHDRLVAGLEQFYARLAECNISHNHIDECNIIVDNRGEWHAIRQYYTSEGTMGDDASRKRLGELIDRYALADGERLMQLHEEYASYGAANIVEQRQRIEQCGLIGFADAYGEMVVECKYAAASDFAECRAVVTDTEHRMGLIDNFGAEVIPTLYDELIYDATSGYSWASKDALWAKFNYLGERISDWRDRLEIDIDFDEA